MRKAPGARSLICAAALLCLAPAATPAGAEQYPPAPQGDDIAFVQLGAVGELVVNGVQSTVDPSTRLLIGRHLVSATRNLTLLSQFDRYLGDPAMKRLLATASAGSGITIYAAASLREALPRIAPKQGYNFAGSGALQTQIERGAPADVFVAASPKEAQALFRAGLCTRPVTFATNSVVMLVPEGNPGNVRSVYNLRKGNRRLAVGAPGVPIGAYTRTLLAKMRLTSILNTNTVTLEANVSGITSKVALGSVEGGFAYVTDGRTVADRVDVIRLPRWAQPPVRYQACMVRRDGVDTAVANRFIDKLVGKQGRAVLKASGFGLPPR